MTLVANGLDLSGTTANRPTKAEINQPYFDTDIGKPLFWNGTAWVEASGAPAAASGVGAAAGTGVTAAEYGSGPVKQTVLTLAALSITMTDHTTAGAHGSQKVYDFPEGLIEILGATTNLTTLAGAGGIGDTAALVGSLGTATVGTGDSVLTGTEADIIPQTAGTLSSGAGTLKGKLLPTLATLAGITPLTDSTGRTPDNTIANHADLSTYATDAAAIESNVSDLAGKINEILSATLNARRVFDGTGTAKDCYLNITVPDAGSSADDTLAVSGTITLTWINHGDN